LGVAAVGLAGCTLSTSPYVETVERSFDPDDADALAVETDGDVSLSSADGDAVAATARKESRSGEDALETVTVGTTTDDGRLVVGTRRPEERVDVTVDIELAVPPDLPVAEVDTENGDIEATDVSGDGSYETTNGEIDVEGAAGAVALSTTNGDVSVTGTPLSSARSTNGNVTADVPATGEDVTLTTTNGDVTAAVAADRGGRVRLRTEAGDASVEGPSVSVEESTDRRIEGRLGEGAHELTLRSTSGDVTLRSL
jgi:hypothetical protein